MRTAVVQQEQYQQIVQLPNKVCTYMHVDRENNVDTLEFLTKYKESLERFRTLQ